ncbi:MAG TPA: hypothetical protein VML50_02825 [Anaeromyxobacter sp.]|nr:hypothetical protein [Anaeromyxobacter sp.]
MRQNTFLHLLLPSLIAAAGCSGEASHATQGPAAPATVQVDIQPTSAQAAAGGTVQFGSTVTGTTSTAVTWSVEEASGGTVSASGLYTAPSSAGSFHVKVTSSADPTAFAVATVTVNTALPVVTVAISPTTAAVNSCQSLTFSATVTGSTNGAVTWSVQEGAAGGTITAGGVYTASSTAGTYHVVATSVANPATSAVQAVTVTDKVLSVAVSPTTASIQTGATAQFTATVTTTCGTFTAAQAITAPVAAAPN